MQIANTVLCSSCLSLGASTWGPFVFAHQLDRHDLAAQILRTGLAAAAHVDLLAVHVLGRQPLRRIVNLRACH